MKIVFGNEQRVEETKSLNLRKTLQHYQKQNGHLNHINDQLVKSNSMIRHDLEDMHTNCVELVKVSEYVVNRRKLSKQIMN